MNQLRNWILVTLTSVLVSACGDSATDTQKTVSLDELDRISSTELRKQMQQSELEATEDDAPAELIEGMADAGPTDTLEDSNSAENFDTMLDAEQGDIGQGLGIEDLNMGLEDLQDEIAALKEERQQAEQDLQDALLTEGLEDVGEDSDYANLTDESEIVAEIEGVEAERAEMQAQRTRLEERISNIQEQIGRSEQKAEDLLLQIEELEAGI